MPTKVKQKLSMPAWSYSRLSKYETCPAQARYSFIDKYPEPENAAMIRGSRIHAESAGFVAGGSGKAVLPLSLKSFKKEYEAARKLYDKGAALVEPKLAFTTEMKPTGWFDDDVWLRVGLDLVLRHGLGGTVRKTAPKVIDVKTGRRRADHLDQLELYAVGYLSTYPEAKQVNTALWYVDLGEEVEDHFSLDQISDLVKKWRKRSDVMTKDKTFKPRPGPACSWCPFAKSKKGPCPKG